MFTTILDPGIWNLNWKKMSKSIILALENWNNVETGSFKIGGRFDGSKPYPQGLLGALVNILHSVCQPV